MTSLNTDVMISTPLLILSAGAMLLLLIDVFSKKDWASGIFTSIVLLVSLVSTNYLYIAGYFQPKRTIFFNQLYADVLSTFVSGLILFAAIFVVLIGLDRLKDEQVEAKGEYYSLLLMSTIGALVFANAAELVTLFIGLEIMSMALYCLCGSALKLRASSESALKYFLLGSFSSAFMLYGIALVYGLTGSTEISVVADKVAHMNSGMLSISIGLILAGLLFKIAAVPFHFWAPDVYQGAPTSITAFMASVIKASAVFATLRIVWTAFPNNYEVWSGAVWTVSLLTMTVGNLIALRQRSVKRMLAYSSIAHAGYMIMALLAPPGSFGGGAAILYYLVAYTAVTLGSFAVVLAVSAPHISENNADDISRFNALAKRNPLLAILMALFMLSLAGIPPGMAGLLGKFYLFSAAVKAGYVGLAIVGVVNSAISAYYYLRIVVVMYFIDEGSDEKFEAPRVGLSMATALICCAAGAVIFGIFPSGLYDNAALIMHSVGDYQEVFHP